jgi:hypothetical protein
MQEWNGTMKQAVFDHVDSDGNLVLLVDGEETLLRPTGALRHAVENAPSLEHGRQSSPLPFEQQTLPIPQIQSLVRAGHSYKEISEKYKVSEEMVRRFGLPVEQEKRSAITQFLAVTWTGSDQESRIDEVIENGLSASGVDPDSVEWSARRILHQPWQITATFPHDGHHYSATWLWNMQDNTVSCANETARKLTGSDDDDDLLFGVDQSETTSAPQPQWAHSDAAAHSTQPKPGTDAFADPRLAHLARTTSSEQSPKNEGSHTSSNSASTPASPATTSKSQEASPSPVLSPADSGTPAAQSDDTGRQPAISQPAASVPPQANAQTVGEAERSAEFPAVSSTNNRDAHADASLHQKDDSTQRSRKRNGHSSIPSWDDIIFGE